MSEVETLRDFAQQQAAKEIDAQSGLHPAERVAKTSVKSAHLEYQYSRELATTLIASGELTDTEIFETLDAIFDWRISSNKLSAAISDIKRRGPVIIAEDGKMKLRQPPSPEEIDFAGDIWEQAITARDAYEQQTKKLRERLFTKLGEVAID